jgi:nucleotide-binding universal stress UspA family protein
VTAPGFRHLLVPVDGSDCSIAAIRYALRLAAKTTHVTFANVIHLGAALDSAVTPAGGDPTIILDALEAERHHVYAAASALARIAGVEAETIDLSGPIVDAIVDLPARIGADAIVMGTHGRHGLARAVLGSVANGVLRRTALPVFVVHAHDGTESGPASAIRRIVVDIESLGWLTPQIALAFDLAAAHDAHIFFVHVAPELDEAAVDQRRALRVAADRAIGYEIVRAAGSTPEAVVNVATAVGADLIVVGSQEREAGRFLRHSICELVVRSSPIPVAVAHERFHADTALRRPA